LARIFDHSLEPHELAEYSRQAMQSYMRYWNETFALPHWSHADIADKVEIVHEERLKAVIERGNGVVIALSHSGNWDLAGAWLALTHGGFTTVAERLKPEGLFERFKAHRESLGMEVLAADGGPRVLATMSTRLREGGTVCLLADRDLNGTGVVVNFFNEPAHFPAGPAALAVSTGAALITVRLSYAGDKLVIDFDEPLVELLPDTATRHDRVQVLTQQVADQFQAAITAHPTDWHMMQSFWDSDRGLS
jgi:KDO2-lipid IV(A) lauroyltransferase